MSMAAFMSVQYSASNDSPVLAIFGIKDSYPVPISPSLLRDFLRLNGRSYGVRTSAILSAALSPAIASRSARYYLFTNRRQLQFLLIRSTRHHRGMRLSD